MLHLQVTLIQDPGQESLLGGDYEYSPILKYWTSWGTTRITRDSPPLSVVNPVSLDAIPLPPHNDIKQIRGDERVWFEMQALSRHSGIDSIDEQEKGRQVYQVHAGQAKIALTELLTHNPGYGATPLELAMVDPQLTLAKMNELGNSEAGKKLSEQQRESAALTAAYKGRIRITFTMSGPVNPQQLLNTLHHAARLEHPGKLMYESPAMVNAMQRMQTQLLTAYSNAFFGRFDAAGKSIGPPTYALGPEASLDHMHLPLMQVLTGDRVC